MRKLMFALSLTIFMSGTIFTLPGQFNASIAASRGGGMVYFNRPAGFNGAFTKPFVIIDGRKIGKIGSGECHRIRLPAGRHQIIVRDVKSILSRLGIENYAAIVHVASGSASFVTISTLREQDEFNEPAPGYDLHISNRGRRC